MVVAKPPQGVCVLVDTDIDSASFSRLGSSDFWLAGGTCTTGCEEVTNPFKSASSSSFVGTQTPIDVKYGKGEVTGEYESRV